MPGRRDTAAPLQDPERLKHKRIEAHLSRPALAEKAGVTRAFIWQLELGKIGARVSTLGAIADALGCDITDLMRHDGNGSAA